MALAPGRLESFEPFLPGSGDRHVRNMIQTAQKSCEAWEMRVIYIYIYIGIPEPKNTRILVVTVTGAGGQPIVLYMDRMRTMSSKNRLYFRFVPHQENCTATPPSVTPPLPPSVLRNLRGNKMIFEKLAKSVE